MSKFFVSGGGTATVGLLMLWALWFSTPRFPVPWENARVPEEISTAFITIPISNCSSNTTIIHHDPTNTTGYFSYDDPDNATFYDDPDLGYTLESPINDWDQKRQVWLNHHPSLAAGVGDRIFVLTGSQPWACKNPIGDHFLLRLFKNKVDYCRIHGYDLYYSDAFMQPKMTTFWAKLPVVRATMVAHPEAEWIWWVDSDAVITDIDFKFPLEKYKEHNLVVDGWPNLIYENRSWIGLNAGVFLIRNCQWSLDFIRVWANMGPMGPDYKKWGQILKQTLKDKSYPDSDDQSALIYLLLEQKESWANRIYIENKYALSGFWGGLVDSFENITKGIEEIEKGDKRLSRRHAEKVRERYGRLKEEVYVKAGITRRPFVTHFTGCQPCSGEHPSYSDEACWGGMKKALDFADDQVVRGFGFRRIDDRNGSEILQPLPPPPANASA
ncbi:glycosyltransferase 6-like [Impatiens glandulifera]|uniref:glycosyltransferase 6-like n=1 Tax=Impatiens glandulifera TaxID=253017 RepID=UPI001FB12CB9|nr:glycosyltransferase 6-like [Impatiens glandulifera]